jgi:phage nucleotide-binding protein
MLVYGDPGAGKTWLAGTADDDPRTSPVLYLDCEGGVTTIRHRREIDVVPVRSIPQLEDIYNKLYHSIDQETNSIQYRTVVIDPVTELADLDMRTIMKAAYASKPETVDIDVPSPREWGKNRNHIRLIVRAFRDLPCHLIITAHANKKEEENQPTKYFPGFAGKLATEIPGFMDIVGYLYAESKTGTVQRKMQVQGTRRIQAKDRTSRLGAVVTDPTIPMLWDMISEDDVSRSTLDSTEETIG